MAAKEETKSPHAWLWNAYQNGSFTDLTVKCAQTEFKVHRLVLCSQSPFFKAACTHDCKELLSGSIDLPEDEPDTIQRLIEYLYRGEYADFEHSQLLEHAKVFAAATRYNVPALATLSVEKYENVAKRKWDNAEFLLSVPYIYQSTHESVRELRIAAVVWARSKTRQLMELRSQDAWRTTCIDVPEFSWMVLDSMAKHYI